MWIMRIKNLAFLLLVSLLISSCFMRINRGFYDFEKSEYDLYSAKKQLKQLKNNILIVSIPSEKHKLRLLKNSNPEKYDEAINELEFVRENFILAMSKFYSYSDYIFISDSSLVDFKKRNEVTHFYDKKGDPLTNAVIDTSSTYFVLKSFRDFDQLFIYDKNNKLPNQPFPYESTLKKKQLLESMEYLDKIRLKYRTYISEAIYILDKRLEKANRTLN